jgi:hypothetical protein
MKSRATFGMRPSTIVLKLLCCVRAPATFELLFWQGEAVAFRSLFGAGAMIGRGTPSAER